MLSRAGSRRAGAQYLWGSLDELFVNLTSPLRIQAFIGSLLPDPRLTQRAKREQRAGSRKTGTRHHESDGSDRRCCAVRKLTRNVPYPQTR